MIKPFVRTVYLPKLCFKLCPVPRGQIEQHERLTGTALRRPEDIAGVERRGDIDPDELECDLPIVLNGAGGRTIDGKGLAFTVHHEPIFPAMFFVGIERAPGDAYACLWTARQFIITAQRLGTFLITAEWRAEGPTKLPVGHNLLFILINVARPTRKRIDAPLVVIDCPAQKSMEIGDGRPSKTGMGCLQRTIGHSSGDLLPSFAFLIERGGLRKPNQIGGLNGVGLKIDAAEMLPNVPGVHKIQDVHG